MFNKGTTENQADLLFKTIAMLDLFTTYFKIYDLLITHDEFSKSPLYH